MWKDLVDEEIVGQLVESLRRYKKRLTTDGAGQFVSMSRVLAVRLQTLETKRVKTRKSFRLSEHSHADGTLREVS